MNIGRVVLTGLLVVLIGGTTSGYIAVRVASFMARHTNAYTHVHITRVNLIPHATTLALLV